ncbi:unnamed protein product [Linum tenue]|uniref:TIR domain-containing protein n=1 Tax=Linum tenue TaxID=586396 RepID=A0AAV0P5C2_9ROSI|nr:unnamed protein product [Linum tenue]
MPLHHWDCAASASDSAYSSSQPLPWGEYEVFLNFRGSDTRYHITDILYHFLVNLRIQLSRTRMIFRKGKGYGPVSSSPSSNPRSIFSFSPRIMLIANGASKSLLQLLSPQRGIRVASFSLFSIWWIPKTFDIKVGLIGMHLKIT